ncbi:hypothetical protein FS837_007069, partial [Tulasnella sp. UAMH 9824]
MVLELKGGKRVGYSQGFPATAALLIMLLKLAREYIEANSQRKHFPSSFTRRSPPIFIMLFTVVFKDSATQEQID